MKIKQSIFYAAAAATILAAFAFSASRIENRLLDTTIKFSGVLCTQAGYEFRDLNKNGKLDVYEDSKQPIEKRA